MRLKYKAGIKIALRGVLRVFFLSESLWQAVKGTHQARVCQLPKWTEEPVFLYGGNTDLRAMLFPFWIDTSDWYCQRYLLVSHLILGRKRRRGQLRCLWNSKVLSAGPTVLLTCLIEC